MQTRDHDDMIRDLGLALENNEKFALVKYFLFWHDRKTDLIGSHYPDVTCLKREGKSKIMIEVENGITLDDRDQVDRLEALSQFCLANKWDYFVVCDSEETRERLMKAIEGKDIRFKDTYLFDEAPFGEKPAGEAVA